MDAPFQIRGIEPGVIEPADKSVAQRNQSNESAQDFLLPRFGSLDSKLAPLLVLSRYRTPKEPSIEKTLKTKKTKQPSGNTYFGATNHSLG